MLRTVAKRAFLQTSKWMGLFWLSGRLTRDKLRILCYHGTSMGVEHDFRRKLFMSPWKFERRLRFLESRGFPVLGLGDAVDALRRGQLPARGTVITIDDGFYSTYRVAWPLLRHFGFPFTVYVTTYYVRKQNPVYGLVVAYMFWQTKKDVIDLDALGLPGAMGRVNVRDRMRTADVVAALVAYGEQSCTEEQRVGLMRALGRLLAVDYDEIAASRVLGLMSVEEIEELAAADVDVQCHTHRHMFPEERVLGLREIQDNRAALQQVVCRRLEHFCYPSGVWSRNHWPVLSEAGMRTATTCRRGLNDSRTHDFALRRFLDGEDVSDIEFEAEMYGYTELVRCVYGGIKAMLRRAAGEPREAGQKRGIRVGPDGAVTDGH